MRTAYVKHRSECFLQIQWRRDVDVNSFTATPVNKKEPSGSKRPSVRLLSIFNMMEKVPTRVNTQTLVQIFQRPKTTTDPPFLYRRPVEPWSFWAANSTAISKRICTFPLNVAFIYLVWTVQKAFWKRTEQEKQWGEGVRSDSRKNSYNGTF